MRSSVFRDLEHRVIVRSGNIRNFQTGLKYNPRNTIASNIVRYFQYGFDVVINLLKKTVYFGLGFTQPLRSDGLGNTFMICCNYIYTIHSSVVCVIATKSRHLSHVLTLVRIVETGGWAGEFIYSVINGFTNVILKQVPQKYLNFAFFMTF